MLLLLLHFFYSLLRDRHAQNRRGPASGLLLVAGVREIEGGELREKEWKKQRDLSLFVSFYLSFNVLLLLLLLVPSSSFPRRKSTREREEVRRLLLLTLLYPPILNFSPLLSVGAPALSAR